MKKKFAIGLLLIFVVIAGGLYVFRENLQRQFFKPTDSSIETGISDTKNAEEIKVITKELTVPWEVVELPNGDILVSERTGNLRRIGRDDQKVHKIEGVQHAGEGGLLGVALHPDFETNNQLYIYLTTSTGDGLINRVERYKYENDSLSKKQIIINNIPGASYHDGGRIAFGPDKKLYITTGDAGKPNLAQDTNSLAGKILRLNDDGSIPQDNPFSNAVYSYGHRNPQGIAWDNNDRLWSTEHGRSGASSGFDELNRIIKGGNYGWPTVEGDETLDGTIGPVVHSGADETWAPAGLAFHDGSLFFTGLRGESLYQAEIESDNKVNLKAHFRSTYGRLRAVTATNSVLYISTSNQDGRGTPNEGDDKIISINWEIFK